MSTLDDLAKKYGSESAPAKKKNTKTTGLDGLYGKLGLETPERRYSNAYENDPYALAVDEAYNRVNNNNLLTSAEDRRQLSAREKYAQRDNESNRQRNSYSLELPKPTAQKDTSRIGDLEDSLIEQKKYGGTTPTQRAERDRRESEYQDYAELQKLNNLLNDDNENWFTNGLDYDAVKKQRDELQFKVDASSQRDKQEAWDREYQQRMSAAMTAADFGKLSKTDYSTLDPTYLQINEGKTKKDDIEGYLSTYMSPELQDKDAWLEALDVSDGVKARIKAEAERRGTEKVYDYDYDYKPTDKSNSGEGTERYEYLTRDEKRVYNYLHSQSAEKADEFLDFMWDTLGERLAEAERQEVEKFAKALPGVSDIVSVPLNLAGGATGLADLAKQTVNHWLTGAPIDTNSAAMRFASTGQEIRNVRSQQLEGLAPNATVFGRNIVSGLYNTVMSGLDSMAAGYVGAGVSEVFNGTTRVAQGITEAILSGTAATQAAREIKERGGSDNQILLGALASGVFEALFENMSIETLPAFADVPYTGWLSVAKNVGKSFVTNFSEEMNTELANILFDTFAMGNVSEYATNLRKYMAENPGMSLDEARKLVVRDFAIRVGEAGVSGALMGGMFGVTSSIQGRTAARQTGHALQTNADRSAFNALLADGLKADEAGEFGKLARDIKSKLDANQGASDLDVGKLYNLAAEQEAEETSPYNEFERAAADLQLQAGRNEIEASKWANMGDELAADTFRDEAQQYRNQSDVMAQFGLRLPSVQSQAQQDFLARRNAENQNAYTPAEREAARSAAEYNANLALQNEAQNNIIKTQQATEAAQSAQENVSEAALDEQENAAQANAEAYTVTPRRLELPTVKESNNGREVYLRDSGQRADSTNPGEQVRTVEEGAGRNPRGQTLGLARDGESSNLTYERKAVSTKELTGGGSDNATIYRVTDGNTQYTRKASEMAKAANMKVVFFGGDNLRIGDVSARGMIDGDTIYIRVDHPQFTADQLMGHELGHKLIGEGKVDVGAIRDKIAELVGQRSSDWLLGEYRQRYNGIKDSTQRVAQAYADAYEGAGMTDAEIWEEMVCDALGGMNAFAGDRTMTDSTRGIVDQYLAEIKNQAEAQQTRAPPGELSQDVINDIQHDRPIDTADEVKASREFDSKYQEKAEKKNKSLGFVAEDIMVKAGKQRAQVKEWLDAIADKLPPDVLGNTWITDQSYGGTEELTTVCIRSIGAHMLMDAIADKLGRPLNVIETTRISQAIFDYTDKPECLYCYVAMDRKAYREFLGSYIEQRDAFIKDVKDGKPAGIKSGKVDADSAYGRFLGNRKNTSNMQDRAKLWLNTYNSGAEFITAKDLANTENLMAAAERNANAEKQVIDATAYAQSASWAKKQISYAAYNNHILRWSQKAIDKLNSHYGMRFYSFSDYSPAFLLENMQMVTDAAVRGLKGLGYTKEIDFAKAFAPTGMNINCSVFAYKDKATGEYLCDGMQGADWTEVQKLRDKYPNVGAVLVATDDAQVEWALEQDWIDVIIPFHMVRTGSVVADYFGWKNYTAMSRDIANDKNAEVKSITPPMHQNSKELYLAKCDEYNLTPRFKKWVDHPNYMRLVNETRQSEGETSPMQPVFDLTGAKASIDAMVKQGGYAPPIGGSIENMLDIADEMAGKIKEGKPLGKLEEARESNVKYSREFTPTAEDTAYLNAVNSGDMETAQKMVDEAAKAAGYRTERFHGTRANFTQFNPDYAVHGGSGYGYYFGDKELADEFGKGGKVLRVLINDKNIGTLKTHNITAAGFEAALKRLGLSADKTYKYMGADSASNYVKRNHDYRLATDLQYWAVNPRKYAENPNAKQRSPREIITILRDSLGLDGIERGREIVLWDNTLMKLADPVTYDDNGNVIPLSERFNTENKDIRYSREFDADLFDVNEDIRKRIANIQDELARTKRRELYWKGQTRRTANKTVREADVNKLAKRLIKSYASTLDAADIAGDLQALGNYIVNNGDAKNELTYEDLRDRADAISKKIVENALAESEGNDASSYRELRSYLRDQTLRLPAENKADLIDYAAFKKANPALKVSTKSGLEVDAAYMELQSKLGKVFFPDDITNPADQLMRIADVVNELKPVFENPYDYQQAEAMEYISSDILDSLLSEEVRQTPPTFADRKAAEIERVRGDYKQKIAALQEQAQQRVENLRARKNEQIEALIDYYAEQKQEARERRADSQARTKLLKIARRLNNKKLPLVMKAQLAQYIGELDLVAKSMTGKTLDKLTTLKDWYETKKAELGEDFIADTAIENKLDRLSKKRINDLTASEVADLTQVLQFFEASIIEANKFKNSKIKEDRYAAGMRVVWDVNNARPGKINWQLRPSSAAMRMVGYDETSPLATAMDEMIEGERRYDLYQREAVKPYEKWINNKRFMKSFSGKDARMLTIKGTDVNGNAVTQQLTPAMLVEMYLASRNEDNMRHYQRGYAVFPNMELYRKGDIDEAYNKTNKVSIKRSAILEAAKQLTQEELAFASAITNYYNNFAPKRLNETSLIIDGYEKFLEENYYPIVSDNKFLNQDYESLDENGNNAGLARPGFGEKRTHASNPAMVRDANLTLMQQIRMNGRYATMAIPLQNMSRLLNVKGKGMSTSVREALTNQYSSSADAYLKKFMRDYAGQSAAKERGLDPILKKVRSKYAGGVLTLGAGTAIKQAASYPTAAAVTGAAPLLKAMNPAMKADVSFIDELTAAFTKRTQGLSSMELGDLASINKSLPKALNWIQAVDVGITNLPLKRAAYFAVRSESPNLKVGSESFKQAVVNKYVEIIEKTQPNYSVALRPEVLRSNSEIVRTISMFMTQPLQNYNLLYDAFGNYNAKRAAWKNARSAEAKAALNVAKRQVVRTVTSQFIASFVFALMQVGWDFWRGKDKKYRDKDGDLTVGSFLKGIGLNMLSNGAGMFVGGKAALELAEAAADGILKAAGKNSIFDQSFYGLESAELGAITDAGKAALNVASLITSVVKASANGEDVDWAASARKLLAGAEDISVMFGVPLGNLTKDMQALARLVFAGVGEATGDKVKADYYAMRIVNTAPADYYNQLYRYYKTDREKFNELYNLMVNDKTFDKLFTPDKIKDAMEDKMKKDQGVDNVKDLDKRFLSPEEDITYDVIMTSAEKSPLWKGSRAAVQQKIKTFAYDAAEGKETKADDMGISYEQYVTILLNLDKYDTPNKSGEYGGDPTNDEVTAALNHTTGYTRQELYNLWQELTGSDSDKNNPYRAQGSTVKKVKTEAKEQEKAEEKERGVTEIDTSYSSMFSGASYDPSTHTLKLKFRGSGKTYTYNVPESVWEDMKNADSLGNFYNSRIKGKYSAA